MKKPAKKIPELQIEQTETPGLRDGRLIFGKIKRGIVSFSSVSIPFDEAIGKKYKIGKGVALDWQGYSELVDDHGIFLIYDVFREHEIDTNSKSKMENIENQIKGKVGKSSWPRLKEHVQELDKYCGDAGHGEIFLLAIWAQLFAEPFEELWLAAMANHAYWVMNDDFAFGYLSALLDQKRKNEGDFLRGKQSVESARLGGLARSVSLKPKTERTLTDMKRRMSAGQTLARAAELSHKNGFGTSAAANRKLWNRHSKK